MSQIHIQSIIMYILYTMYIVVLAKFTGCRHCRFGGVKFSYSRMSWIKTNFLWMMYRCGWCTKKDQERVLAVRITREGFNTILSKALTGRDEKEKGLKTRTEVRLQWDPDHSPSGVPEKRRAIQLGLRDEVRMTSSRCCIQIDDSTVHDGWGRQHSRLSTIL